MMYDGMGGVWIVMMLAVVLLVALIVWAITRLFPGPTGERAGAAKETPAEELDRRLVRGEVDPDTYDRLREKLQDAHSQRELT